MASPRRLEKLNNLIREELSKILNREVEFPEGIFVTLTRVSVSEDVLYATVFVSVIGASAEDALEIIRKNIYNIQQKLNKKMRMRPVPRIKFAADKNEENREDVEKSLANLKLSGKL